MTREYTKKLWAMLDDGLVSYEHVVTCCLAYMSEYDVKDMMEANELLADDDDDDTDDDDEAA